MDCSEIIACMESFARDYVVEQRLCTDGLEQMYDTFVCCGGNGCLVNGSSSINIES